MHQHPLTRPSVRRAATVLLAAYGVLLFAATHVPPHLLPKSSGGSDKLSHFAGYAGLAFLAAAAWRSRRRLDAFHYLVLIAGLAACGAVDECTQAIVGRSPEWLDWWADLAGIAAGLAAFAVVDSLVGRVACNRRGALR